MQKVSTKLVKDTLQAWIYTAYNYLALLIGGFTQAAPSAVQSPNPSITLSGCGQSPARTCPIQYLTAEWWLPVPASRVPLFPEVPYGRPGLIPLARARQGWEQAEALSARPSPSTATGHALPTTSCQD